jgi:hypothetical protein
MLQEDDFVMADITAATTYKLGSMAYPRYIGIFNNKTSSANLAIEYNSSVITTLEPGTHATLLWDGATWHLLEKVTTVAFVAHSHTWTEISKSGSSLGDLDIRSAGDLNSGNLNAAQMPTQGSWSLLEDFSLSTAAGKYFTLLGAALNIVLQSTDSELDNDNALATTGYISKYYDNSKLIGPFNAPVDLPTNPATGAWCFVMNPLSIYYYDGASWLLMAGDPSLNLDDLEDVDVSGADTGDLLMFTGNPINKWTKTRKLLTTNLPTQGDWEIEGDINITQAANTGMLIFNKTLSIAASAYIIGKLITAVATSSSAAAGDNETLMTKGGLTEYPIDELGAASDTTDNDATAQAHGLLPKLSNDVVDVLRGDGTWGALL